MFYPVKLTIADGTFLVSCRDVPELHSVGDTEEDALQNAVDSLESALQFYIQDRQPIPAPTAKKRGERLVALPALAVAKIGLYTAMLEAGTRKADLARKLGLHPPQVDRLLDLRHSSKLELVQAALFALGRVVNISVSRYNAREAFVSRHWP